MINLLFSKYFKICMINVLVVILSVNLVYCNKNSGETFIGGLTPKNIPISIIKDIKNEINIINKLKFRKQLYVCFVNKDNRIKWVRSDLVADEAAKGVLSYTIRKASVYFDRNDKIRKLIDINEYAEGGTSKIEYFNESGDLELLLYRILWVEFVDQGAIFFHKGYAIKIATRQVTPENQQYKVVLNRIPSEKIFSYHLTTGVLMKEFEINTKSIHPMGSYDFTDLNLLGKGIYINTNYVNIRRNPSTNSEIVGVCHTLDRVAVISIAGEENLPEFGKFKWYEINYNNSIKGFVFGAFLDPLERQVK